ncbi:MAG: YfhO family protein, partial [Oscillospiraceae bacterium]
EGYTYLTTENEFDIYTNDNYIPMGFTYDYYVDDAAFDSFIKQHRDRLMLSALYLTDEQIVRYKDILSPLQTDAYPMITAEGLTRDSDNRKKTSCYEFTTDTRGFTAKIDTPTEELVFFSVPYEKGFTAEVNGNPAVIENVNKGFMAVRVPAGNSTIRFSYKTPGLVEGILISLIALTILGLFVLLMHHFAKRHPDWKLMPYAHLNRESKMSKIVAHEAYSKTIFQKTHAILHELPMATENDPLTSVEQSAAEQKMILPDDIEVVHIPEIRVSEGAEKPEKPEVPQK